MNWHTAQIVFMTALFIVLGIGGFVGAYVAWTTMWSDRWAVRPKQDRAGTPQS